MNQFDLNVQWQLYLQRVGLKEEDMDPVQLTETRRAFFGACGQILILMRDEFSPIAEENVGKGAEILEYLFNQVGDYWMAEVAKHDK